MKKSNFKTFIWSLLACVSLFCYTYLHTVSVKNYGVCPSSFLPAQVEKTSDMEELHLVKLPDVVIVQRIINISKMVKPGS